MSSVNATFTVPRWLRVAPIGIDDRLSVTDVVVAGLDEPALIGEDHSLGPVAQTQLGENARHVRFHRGGPDKELLRDLGVAGSTRDRGQYLALAVGEPFQATRYRGKRQGGRRTDQ